MSEIEYVGPPEDRSHGPNGGFVPPFLAEIRSRPGEWGRLPMKDRPASWAAVNSIRRGKYANVRAAEYEATARFTDGIAWLYARYLGAAATPGESSGAVSQ